MDNIIEEALAHIRYLSDNIGSRGSCTAQERLAADYVRSELEAYDLQDIKTETFRAVASTYRPFMLSFLIAIAGTLVGLVIGDRIALIVAALANILGVWGMFAETEFTPNWTRWLSPKSESQNVSATIWPTKSMKKRVVLCAHLDTHRTPIFYSTKAWHTAFSTLVGLTFASMLIGMAAFGAGVLFSWTPARWFGLVIAPIELLALGLCLHADFTPFSPGANDNASGVAIILGLAKRLKKEPLAQTEVRVVFTGCEEVGAYGMTAYLDTYAEEFGTDTVYIILDEVGLGKVKYLTMDGLVIKHKTHPRALELVQALTYQTKSLANGGGGIAYTDALPATKRGLVALTLCTIPRSSSDEISHWHQMSDTIQHVDISALSDIVDFTWSILQLLDEQSNMV